MWWIFLPNALTVREARERWRRPWTMGALGAYAAFLAVCGALLFGQNVPREFHADRDRIGAGRALFQQFATLQLVAWTALGFFLGAPALAVERQRRSLLDLFLAGLTPAQIVAAKWRSVAGFALVVMLCPLPVLSLCFVMGGVSPAEFGAFVAFLISVGLTSCAMGLLLSAESRDVSSALSAATLCGGCFLSIGGVFVVVLPIVPPILAVVGVLGAVMTIGSLLDLTRDKLALICTHLGDEAQIPHRFEAKATFETDAAPASAFFTASRQDWEDGEFVLPTLIGGEFRPPPASARVEVEVEGRHDIELSRWENQLDALAQKNPVARRMWRAYLNTTARFQAGPASHPARFALVVGAILGLWSYFYGGAAVWETASWGAAAVLSGLLIAQLAPSLAREREAATLEPLVLSALSPREIVAGKLWGAFLIALRLGFWPLVALLIWGLSGGVARCLMMQGMIAAQLVFSACVAAWASLRCRQGSVAASVSWGIVLILWGVGILSGAFRAPLWSAVLALAAWAAWQAALGQLRGSFTRR